MADWAEESENLRGGEGGGNGMAALWEDRRRHRGTCWMRADVVEQAEERRGWWEKRGGRWNCNLASGFF